MSDVLPNLRDVGGMTTSEGGRIRSGRVLRSALPLADDLIPDHIHWPPETIIDLRSFGEVESVHPLKATGAKIRQFPLLSALRPGVAPPESLGELYLLMLRNSTAHLVDVIDAIAFSSGPTLVHCAAGKDRTGVSIALMLALAGVDRDQIVSDYLQTAQHEAQIQERFRRVFGVRRAELPASYLSTPVDAIVGVLDVWEDYRGGAQGWFRAAGGTGPIIDQLRRNLVE